MASKFLLRTAEPSTAKVDNPAPTTEEVAAASWSVHNRRPGSPTGSGRRCKAWAASIASAWSPIATTLTAPLEGVAVPEAISTA